MQYIVHEQADIAVVEQASTVRAVDCEEMQFFSAYSEVMGEERKATSAISAKRAFAAIAVVIDHAEIVTFLAFKQHESVSTDAKMPVAPAGYGNIGGMAVAVIDDNEVVACALVFMEYHSP